MTRSPGLPEIAVEKAEDLLEELMEERNRETTDSSPVVILTINVPLILKMRDSFLQANYILRHFKGYFEGAKIFFTPKLSSAQRRAISGS
jgi:hypothetical protein